MRGRKPAPTPLKILNGTRPSRINQDEPEAPPGAPECPEDVAENDVAKAEWDRMSALLLTMGVLTQVDGATLGLYCRSHSLMLQADAEVQAKGLSVETENGSTKTNPAVAIAHDNRVLCLRLLTEFGCSPAARSRVKTGKAAPKDDFEQFKQRRKTNA